MLCCTTRLEVKVRVRESRSLWHDAASTRDPGARKGSCLPPQPVETQQRWLMRRCSTCVTDRRTDMCHPRAPPLCAHTHSHTHGCESGRCRACWRQLCSLQALKSLVLRLRRRESLCSRGQHSGQAWGPSWPRGSATSHRPERPRADKSGMCGQGRGSGAAPPCSGQLTSPAGGPPPFPPLSPRSRPRVDTQLEPRAPRRNRHRICSAVSHGPQEHFCAGLLLVKRKLFLRLWQRVHRAAVGGSSHRPHGPLLSAASLAPSLPRRWEPHTARGSDGRTRALQAHHTFYGTQRKHVTVAGGRGRGSGRRVGPHAPGTLPARGHLPSLMTSGTSCT